MTLEPRPSRRFVLRGSAAMVLGGSLGGCLAMPDGREPPAAASAPSVAGEAFRAAYAALPAERFPVEALDLSRVDPGFLRREVAFETAEAPGSIVVDPAARYLYLVEGGRRARRYGVGVGAEGSSWSGVARVNSKQEWPDWYPTAEMLERRPDIREVITPLRSGMGIPGGPINPVGARALYLWQGNKDTLYRIHGTTEPYTVGQAVSSGCIRMINQDVIDLYGRVAVGAKVTVLAG